MTVPGVQMFAGNNPKKDEQAFRDLADALLVLKMGTSIATDPRFAED